MNKNYVPLYRKYRPQTIEQIVGQEHIKRALSNAIEMNHISHAYLFTGPRGTGKTSTARIFAKSLNCLKGPTINPCNECENCLNITNSVPIDVIEIDAASNRSVNDADDIIQKVALAPVNSKYKIYIIDEVHMLTPQAFNALLKTLEEPPANVIFILATTEVHKVLDTIKSRCQRFDFKRITTEDIAKHLRYISDQEKINITDDALLYIAQNSAGGMRDSIALLDQLSVLNSENEAISVDDINKLLGRLSFDSLNSLFESIANSDQNSALSTLNSIYDQGNEPIQILSNFLEYLRNALIVKSTDAKSGIVQLGDEQLSVLKKSLENIEIHQIVSLTDKCSTYIKEIKQTSNPKLWLDIAILDMANLTQNSKLEELQRRISLLESGDAPKINVSPYNTPPSPVLKQSVSMPVQPELSKQADSSAINEHVKVVDDSQVDVPGSKSQNLGSLESLWNKLLSGISSDTTRTILSQQAYALKITPDEVLIAVKSEIWLKKFSPGENYYKNVLEATKTLFGSEPKLIMRTPLPGDSKLQKEQNVSSDSVKQTPRQSLKFSSQPVIAEEEPDYEGPALEDAASEDVVAVSDDSDTIAPSSKGDNLNKSAEYSFHSDNVNMAIDLFEGKFIE